MEKTACGGEIEPVDPGLLLPVVSGYRNTVSCAGGLSPPQFMFALLTKVWEPLRVQGKQYECGHIPAQHSFKSPQGIAQWSALAAQWTLRNTYRKGGTATLDTLLAIWIKLTALLVGWEPLSAFSHTLQLFRDTLVHFKNEGVISGPRIIYVEPSDQETQRASKRQRKDNRKQELAVIALQQIQNAQKRGLHLTDGSEFVEGVGWIAGFGCHQPGFWEEAHHLPLNKKQSINHVELMAVTMSVRRTHTCNQPFAVATDSSYVCGGARGSDGVLPGLAL